MKIEHIAIWTNKLEEIKEFYIKYFNAKVGNKYTNPVKKFESYFLAFERGARLELMSIEGMEENDKNKKLSGYAHIAFTVGSREKVDEMTDMFRKDGYTIEGEPRITGDGYYESVVLDPDGNKIEIVL